MQSGVVKFFIPLRGFGFITPKDGGPDVFVHVKELRKGGLRAVTEGQNVEYEAEPGKDGKPKAVKVQLVA